MAHPHFLTTRTTASPDYERCGHYRCKEVRWVHRAPAAAPKVEKADEEADQESATQARRILAMLSVFDWVCGSMFLNAYMPRYSARIHTLRHTQGHDILSRPCEQHPHDGNVYEFKLLRKDQP